MTRREVVVCDEEVLKPAVGRCSIAIVLDRLGRAHLGAAFHRASQLLEYVDLLAPVGATSNSELDLEHLNILAGEEQVSELCRAIERSLHNDRIKQALVQLVSATSSMGNGTT